MTIINLKKSDTYRKMRKLFYLDENSGINRFWKKIMISSIMILFTKIVIMQVFKFVSIYSIYVKYEKFKLKNL